METVVSVVRHLVAVAQVHVVAARVALRLARVVHR